MYNHRIKDSNDAGTLLGYTEFVYDFGPSVEAPTVWRKVNGSWTARWIRDSSMFTYSLDDEGNVYGQSSSGKASIWDSNLIRSDLQMPTGFTGGNAYGRLRDGRIVGKLFKPGVGSHMAIWNSASASPTVTFISSWGQIEAPALSTLDMILLTEARSPQELYTWTPSGGVQQLSTQVIGGLPTDRQAIFGGDGGHIIALTYTGGAKTWLLTPVPEPGTLIALASGPLVLLRKRLRWRWRR